MTPDRMKNKTCQYRMSSTSVNGFHALNLSSTGFLTRQYGTISGTKQQVAPVAISAMLCPRSTEILAKRCCSASLIVVIMTADTSDECFIFPEAD